MIKICLLADSASIHTVRWCRYFNEGNFRVEVISFKNAPIEGIKVHYVDAGNIDAAGGNWKVLLKYKKVKKLLKEIKPDVLHAHYATSYGIVGALTGFKPFVVTALGSDVLVSARQSKLYKRLVRYVMKKASHITAMAPHMQKAIEDLGIPASKISVVMFGIDPQVFNRTGRKTEPGKFLIASTRNFEPIYNHQLFFDALKLVKDKIDGLEVVMVGEGSQRAFFENYVKENNLSSFVTFKGRIPQPQIADILRQSHLFVTLAFSDGNCISLNEAMACGAFSIAGSIPATQQWIVEGKNGFLVPVDSAGQLAEKILEVHRHFDELIGPATALNDRLVAEKALWQVNMQQMEKIYTRVTRKNA